MSGKGLRNFYVERGPRIFPTNKAMAGAARGLFKKARRAVAAV